MSVDIESWVQRPIFNVPIPDQTKELDGGHVLRSTRMIIELFRKHRTKATFFVLGTVAEWYPELIEEIVTDGHEVGLHGYTHKRLCDHTRESFDEEIKKTISILNEFGVDPKGYRAPAFSRAEFLYEVLSDNGIEYDSSIIPVKTPLYDGTSYDCHPFIIDRGILEIPCSVWKMSKLRIPVGGFYVRLLGARVNCKLLEKIDKRYGIAVMYFHPWEVLDIPGNHYLDQDERPMMPFLKKQFSYYNIPMLDKLEYLLENLNFTNIKEARRDIDKLVRE
jgi:polysaccharide deacetylase family protein (PEP-CTERM system associated)